MIANSRPVLHLLIISDGQLCRSLQFIDVNSAGCIACLFLVGKLSFWLRIFRCTLKYSNISSNFIKISSNDLRYTPTVGKNAIKDNSNL